jgi:hypothetical protein
MLRIAAGIAMVLGMACAAAAGEPEGLRERFLSRITLELERLPDYVCTQSVERYSRASAEKAWEKVDTLRFEVAMVGNRELYARPGARGFDETPLAHMVGRGTVGTGKFALLARHVFIGGLAQLTYRGESEENGRRAYEYTFDVPPSRSSYLLRSGPEEAVVGFQGGFWIDAETLDLLRLDSQAYDMPEPLALAEANTSLRYAPVEIAGKRTLLPIYASLSVAGIDGAENMNRLRLDGCRHYQVESTLRADGDVIAVENSSADRIKPPPAQPSQVLLPGSVLELALAEELDPASAAIGQLVRASVTEPVKDGERILIPEGTPVVGNLVRLDKEMLPFPRYEIGIEFHALQLPSGEQPVNITMAQAGPARGLLRQAKRLDPEFTRKRTARLDILVREVQRGQGILMWDARVGRLPRGLRMKWVVERAEP